MNALRWLLVVLLSLCAATFVAGCDSSSDGPGVVTPGPGETTIKADEGINFTSGEHQDPGNYANSDIYATSMGSHLKLATGSDRPTTNRPVNWFPTGGGKYNTYVSLADVPDAPLPTDADTASLTIPEQGNGFITLNAAGTYTKGWLKAVTATSITIEYAPLP